MVGVGVGVMCGICSLWNSRNLTTRTNQCQLFVSWGWALLGPLQPCPSPQASSVFGGAGERGGPCFVCGWGRGGGGSKNFWLLSGAGPARLARWGCMLITYLIREEFKVCVLGRGRGGREPPLETSSPRPVMVRCLQGFFVVAVVFNYLKVLNSK